MITDAAVKTQRSEQQLPSVSCWTYSESCSVPTIKIDDEEEALASDRNKQYVKENGGETKTKTLTKVLGYYRSQYKKCT